MKLSCQKHFCLLLGGHNINTVPEKNGLQPMSGGDLICGEDSHICGTLSLVRDVMGQHVGFSNSHLFKKEGENVILINDTPTGIRTGRVVGTVTSLDSVNDTAVFKIHNEEEVAVDSIRGIGKVKMQPGAAVAALGVRSYGAASGLVDGFISNPALATSDARPQNVPTGNVEIATLSSLPISQPMDSGKLWVDTDGHVVAQHHSHISTRGGGYSYGSHVTTLCNLNFCDQNWIKQHEDRLKNLSSAEHDVKSAQFFVK